MVQLDAVFIYFLPDAEADVAARRRQKRVFKFSSIGVPDLEGFEELERIRRSWRRSRATRHQPVADRLLEANN
jgi:hypothetical protein